MREKFFGRLRATCCNGYGARPEMAGAGDVVRRVSDDDELRGLEINLQLTVDALLRDGGQIAAVVAHVAERAREVLAVIE